MVRFQSVMSIPDGVGFCAGIGIVTYTMMDGMNGAFGAEWGVLPVLHKDGYRNVDRRYRVRIVTRTRTDIN